MMYTLFHTPRSLATQCCALFAAVVIFLGTSQNCRSKEIRFEVHEEAGIRRFSFPVRVQLQLDAPVTEAHRFRLLRDGKPLVAQFRRDRTVDSGRQWWVDFNTSLLPYQTQQFVVQHGTDIPAGRQRLKGHALAERGGAFQIVNAPYITWIVAHDLKGLLSSVAFPPNEHLRSDSPGLLFVDRDGNSHRINGDSCQVTPHIVTQGPLGIGLHFDVSGHQTAPQGVTATVDLYFPVSKSWVEVVWQVRDPQDEIAAIAAELNLNIDPPTAKAPTLVDFGATSLVYAALRAGQQAELRAGAVDASKVDSLQDRWQVLRGSDQLQEFVSGPPRGAGQTMPEGWAHVMDHHRCLALAVHEFSRHGQDRIHTTSVGRVRVERRFSVARTGAKQLRFWMHFVYFPPHISAATSPQAMQNPLTVRFSD